jgi:DNA-binding transcriptional regulator/RsmH inhibitor MraZ
MEEYKVFLGKFEHKIVEMDSIPILASVRSKREEGTGLTPGVENQITVYPLAEWKKMAVCNLLVRMRGDA